jgi:hypothetical protein
MKNNWINYNEIDFFDESIKAYHIDTRDFFCATNDFSPKILGVKHLKNRTQYFHNGKEIKDLIDRLFNESGGAVKWRMLTLCNEGKRYTGNWQLKYIRIYRLEYGLLVCIEHNDVFTPLSKQILAYKVNQKYLFAH